VTAQYAPSAAGAVHRCTVCGATASREASFADIVIYRCPACDHAFTDVAALDQECIYDEAWEGVHANWFANPNVSLFDFIADRIAEHAMDASVIDIGAGNGALLKHLRARNPRLGLTGLDLAFKPDLEDVEIISADFGTNDFGDRKWDVAVSLATIEHVADVELFARKLKEILVPGGLAIVMTLDDRSVLYASARTLRKVGFSAPFERLYDRHHLNHFSSTSLRTLMSRAGFDVVGTRHRNTPMAAVDIPGDSPLLRVGVWGAFVLGRLLQRTYLQTIVVRA
jgi:SAM-dependent methyltransferase